jgi:hypothetical protein
MPAMATARGVFNRERINILNDPTRKYAVEDVQIGDNLKIFIRPAAP